MQRKENILAALEQTTETEERKVAGFTRYWVDAGPVMNGFKESLGRHPRILVGQLLQVGSLGAGRRHLANQLCQPHFLNEPTDEKTHDVVHPDVADVVPDILLKMSA